MYLWNPSIRKSIILPQPIVSSTSHGAFMHALGFGFHANDYKIVRVVHLLLVPGYIIKVPSPLVELYELSTGSWRRISAGEFPYVIDECAPQAFLNGVVHWFGFNPDDCKGRISHLIVSFDLRNEALGALMVPASAQQDWDCHMHVAVYGESLSLIHKPRDENSCNIWVMKEYGEAKSWTKQFTIDLNQVNFARKYFFRENGDILMAPNRGSPLYCADGSLVSYDPKSKQINKLRMLEQAEVFYVVNYMESLVLLEGLNGVLGRVENCGKGASLLPKRRG